MSYCIDETSSKHTYRGAVRIAETLGIQVKKCDPSYINNSKGQSKAEKCGDKIEYFILLSENLSLEEKRLTLAHEMSYLILGHLIGDYVGEQYNISTEQQEFEAEALGLMLYNFWYGMKSSVRT